MESSLSSSKITEILVAFPELNPDWLLLGKGDMLRGSAPAAAPDSTIDRLLERIEDLARENGQLQAENAELRKKLARAEEKAAACVAAAG